MAKKQRRKNKPDFTKENKRFLNYLLKVHERLTIILDDNMSKCVDPKEEDIQFLEEMMTAFDNSSMSWAKHEDSPDEIATQGILYADIKADER